MNRVDEPNKCVDQIISKVGKAIRVATPLAAGKPNTLLNSLYQRAKSDSSIDLTIYTALTLEKPKGKSDLEKRFLGPFVDRVFADYPDLDYELARTTGALPENIKVVEFYFPPGKYMSNAYSQQNYISSNYTHVARDLLDAGVNVMMQMVASDEIDGEKKLSLSCNPDVTLDILSVFKEKRLAGGPVFVAGQINNNLPFMFGDCVVAEEDFDCLLDNQKYEFQVFGPPKMSVGEAEHMIGLYCSNLIKDGGELQVGIGSLGDAFVYSLIMRHEQNQAYKKIIKHFGVEEKFSDVISQVGGLDPLPTGLFGATEMFVDGFAHLMQANILRRRVYDDLPIQRLLNRGAISEKVEAETLLQLLAARAIGHKISFDDFRYLQKFGVFKQELTYEDGKIFPASGSAIPANLEDPEARERILSECLGDRLKCGVVAHGGFFLGPQSFYSFLRDLPEEQRKLIDMRSVTRINQLYGHEEIDRLHRKDARFVNTCLKMTLLGAAVSDGLEDGRVVSGVGGQYNFVSMAHALPDGRSVLNLRSTRGHGACLESNIVYNYGHVTIPRHLRDIVVTEYGIAMLRGKTDAQVIDSLLRVADSRFQDELQATAIRAGKLPADHKIPEAFRNNTPSSYLEGVHHYRRQSYFGVFPFGTDLTDDEITIGRSLKQLKKATSNKRSLAKLMLEAAVSGAPCSYTKPYLQRMRLDRPSSGKEKLYQRLLACQLRKDRL